MPNKRIELVIPAPCQQRWQDMKPENAGRFCDSCQKTVVDFTAMTDQQIGAYFLSQPKNVCGRFAASQLNRDVVLAQNAPNRVMKQRWLGLMTAGLLSWSTAQAQSTQLPDNNVFVSGRVAPESTTTIDQIEQHVTPTLEDSTRVIVGRVIAGKEPLPGVYIIVKGTQRGTATDASGSFKLYLTPQDDQLVLRTGYVGFISQEIEINSTRKLPLTISLAEDTTTLGEVICIRKPNFLQRLKNRLRASH